jgi:hypothetical protein
MKVVIELNTENPEENMEFKRIVAAGSMANCLFEISHNTKKQIRRELECSDANDIDFDLLDKVFDRILEIYEDNGINIDSLTN